jgi:hypothetical protein
MSVKVRIPSARARSPERRSADQNSILHLAPQKRCGDPPRRPRNGRSHHLHKIEDLSVITVAFERSLNGSRRCDFDAVAKWYAINTRSA